MLSGMEPEPKFVGLLELARTLKVSPSSIRRAVRRGRIPAVRLAPKGPPRFVLAEVLKALATRGGDR
jgi:hypothetical protein